MIQRYNVHVQDGDIDDVTHYVGFDEAPDGNVVLHRDVVAAVNKLRAGVGQPDYSNPELKGFENGFHTALDAVLKELGQ